MDAKEIKTQLKNAREAIRKKEFKDALKHCKAVVAQDKNNYNAWVFIGVAAEGLEQPDQAIKAFKRAIDSSPDQVLAWQGLCSFYEKNPTSENNSDLVNVYQKLSELYNTANDKEKKDESLRKLAQLDVKIGAHSMAIPIYKGLIDNENDETKMLNYQKELLDVLLHDRNFSQEDEILFMNTCEVLFKVPDTDIDNLDTVLQVFIDVTIKNSSPDIIQATCRELHEKFPCVVYPLEILILIYLDRNVVSPISGTDSDFDTYMDELRELCDTSSILKVAEGLILIQKRDYLKARGLMRQASENLKKLVCVHYYLSLIQFYLHDDTDAETCSKTCLHVVQKKDRLLTIKSSDVVISVKYLQARILYHIGTKLSLETALTLIQEVISTKPDEARVLMGYVYLKLGDLTKAQEYTDSTDQHEMVAFCGWFEFCNGNPGAAVERLQEAIKQDPLCSEYHLMLARALWEIWMTEKNKTTGEECYTHLLKAAKLDPYNSETFLYLGHFYVKHQRDDTKARKCYQKSFDLNKNNEEAGAALCDLLTASKNSEEAHKLLVMVTSQASAGSAKWAWLRLGLYQMEHEDLSVSISSFQSALRADPRDNHVWECLAEAYQQRGSYTAALKAFTKAAELNSESLYCLFQIGAIKQTLGEYTDAITEYKLILEREQNYVPALKGLGETYLLLARSHISKFFNGRGRDNCQEALIHLTRAVSHRPDLSCLWKLMGDACTIIHHLCNEEFSMRVPVKLIQKTSQYDEMCTLDLPKTLELGARCYGKAISILPECASLWHDLGVNFFHQSNHGPKESAFKLAEKSINSLKKALSLDTANHKSWNALGVVACSNTVGNLSLGQHCFIKSIQTEANNVVAWTNLATLYLKHENIKLAHEAFKVAQSLEPSYVACWIGQALIAEAVGDEDAMDLFRHTTELTTHIESALGYAHWVCSILQDETKRSSDLFTYAIKQMAAIPAASDALAKYLDRVKTNPTAFNMYGLLLEHQNLLRSAAAAYKSAISLFIPDKEGGNNEQLTKTKINLARVLSNYGEFEESLSVYHGIGDQLSTLEDICSLGLTLYRSGQYKESYQAYTQALGLSKTDEEKSLVLSALGMVAYRFGDIEGAKSVFLQSSQLSFPSIHGLQALCALGILQSDNTLTMAVLQELFNHGDKNSQPSVAHLMTISSCLLENNWKAASRYVQQCIHKDPSQAVMWKLLSAVLLQHCPDRGSPAATCAKSSLLLDPDITDACSVVTLAQMSAGLHVNKDHNNNALVSAQIAVHLHPDCIENWYNLTAATFGQAMMERDLQRCLKLHHTVVGLTDWLQTKGIEKNENLQHWCQKLRIISLMLINEQNQARQILQTMARDNAGTEVQEFTSLMIGILDGDMSKLTDKISSLSEKIFCIQVLMEMCNKKESPLNVNGLQQINSHLNMGDNSKETYMLHLYRAFHIYRHLIVEDNEELSTMFNESVKTVLKFDPKCSAVKLMQAALSIESETRQAKRCLLQINEECSLHVTSRHCLSIARRCLIHLLFAVKKDSQTDAIQEILLQSREDGDEETVQYYQQLTQGENK